MAINKHIRILFLLLIYLTAFTIFSLRDIQAGDGSMAGTEKIWTSWSGTHYALIDDGPHLWIGSGSGLIRFQKENGQHTRFATPDGFPHRQVTSGAVDSNGSRWFGGDGGLSRLGDDEQWTHFDTGNSGIAGNQVSGIAVGAGGDLWLSHGESLQISHRRPDGTWQIFDNREDTVSANYTAVKETSNENKLWTVSGDEVWVGYRVYDGVEWETRRPKDAYGDPLIVSADSQGTIWALESGKVFMLQAEKWWVYFVDEDHAYNCCTSLQTLAIDATDAVWVGGQKPAYGVPDQNQYDEAAITLLPEKPGAFQLDQTIYFPPPVVDMLPTADGLWLTGNNWLQKVDGGSVFFSDGPYSSVRNFFVDGHGISRLSSGSGAYQIVDDRGTATIQDDVWARDKSLQGSFAALELVEDGDFWMAENPRCYHCFPWIGRYHDGESIYYAKPDLEWESENDDIFAEDSRHTWFIFLSYVGVNFDQKPAIYQLDDRGTPVNQDDDVWTAYPPPIGAQKEYGTGHHLIAASNGRLWYGHPGGVYQKKGQDWELITAKTPYEFVTAKDGTLLVNIGEGKVLVISPGGEQVVQTIDGLVAARPELIRTTTRRNQMWTVAPDRAIWYWNEDNQLVRWHEFGVQTFDTPVKNPTIEVDRNNHVWLGYEGALWRMSPRPDFDIGSGPSTWLMMPNESRTGNIIAVDISGYDKEIALEVSDLPPGMSAGVVPELVHAGETAELTLTSKDVPLGEYSFTIKGSSGEKSRSRTVKLVVVEEVHTLDLPLVLRGY